MTQPIIPTFESYDELYEQPEDWKIAGISYDGVDFVFDIAGNGYPQQVKLWAGNDAVVDAVDPEGKFRDDETGFETQLQSLVNKLESAPESLESNCPEMFLAVKTMVEDEYDQDTANSDIESKRTSEKAGDEIHQIENDIQSTDNVGH